MKFSKMLELATQTFVGVRLGGKKSDPKLAEMDRGVLTVGLLVAAIDGMILPEEYGAFRTLSKKCRGGSAKNVRMLMDLALPAAGQLMAMAQVREYSERERLAAFLGHAAGVLPRAFAGGSMVDLRRAFALWVTVAVSDGDFSAIERSAIGQLEYFLASARSRVKGKSGSRILEPDFLAKAERFSRSLAVPSKCEKAEAALEELIMGPNVARG